MPGKLEILEYSKEERLQLAYKALEEYREGGRGLVYYIERSGLKSGTFYGWMRKHKDLANAYLDALKLRNMRADQDITDATNIAYVERMSGNSKKRTNTIIVTGKLANGHEFTESADMKDADTFSRLMAMIPELNDVIVQTKITVQDLPPSDSFILGSTAGFGEEK